jgi:hypothetical protein
MRIYREIIFYTNLPGLRATDFRLLVRYFFERWEHWFSFADLSLTALIGFPLIFFSSHLSIRDRPRF